MSLQGEKDRILFDRAKAVIPYGVNSNFRYWGDDDTLIATRGKGAYIWDADGKRYIDYRLGFGPIILGHGYPAVVERVQEAIGDGTVFAWTTPYEIELCERIARMCKVDKVRLTNTGTEATMHALRIARAYTGREKFIKFEGQYHGMADYFMFSTASAHPGALGSRRNPINAPATSGIPKGISQYVINLPFNDFERLEKTIAAQWGDIAAIFIEPLLGNAAGIMPRPGFLEKIRELCDQYGIVMVFDEVKTGFRIANGGAQEYFGVRADLVTYAKSLGNGFPIAAIAGKEEVMMTIEPGAMAHGGTYSGNVVAAVAGIATLETLEALPVIETINRRGRALMDGIREVLTEADIPHYLPGLPPMFGIVLGIEEEPHDFRDYFRGDGELYERLVLELIQRGVQPDGDAREPWFLCYALSEEDVNETLNIFNDAIKAAKQ
ncbi:MAG: aminotransferase class III-fold pyridoxal phosphate-dependent enzyme [Anaerolineae bacterium]|nr:MAG: aminotransferase class III-fold pyridoxal phosphate-dependent enzyme [Anaerolineae bacterium]